MYNNPNGGTGGWAPGMGMPPLGFGVVAQQPPGNMRMAATQPVPAQAHHITQWQQQQFIASQMGMASSAVSVQPIVQPQQQQGFHQYQQSQPLYPQQQYHQQQQWMEAQKKAAEGQRKLYDQMMKQRQFDEQKMRLQAFSNTKKAGVSADSMIENILGRKDSQKPRSPPAPKKVPEKENLSSTATLISAKQGTAVDWSNMKDVDSLFAQNRLATQTPAVSTQGGTNTSDPTVEGSTTPVSPNVTNIASNQGIVNQPGLPAGTHGMPTDNRGVTSNTSIETGVTSKNPMGKPIPLPIWLSDKTNVPSVYTHAMSLVEGKDGWVDTSRAYMLLMQTGLPAPFLGILWEMVNRTQPGQLTNQEFITLLALVALVQGGQAITTPDVLSATNEPVLPIIDHPALMPLVQDYIQQKQKEQQQKTLESENQSGTNEDDDEFEDFVSVPTPIGGQVTNLENPSAINTATMNVMTPAQPCIPSTLPATQISNKELSTSADKLKRMNLPELGFSPDVSPTTSFDNAQDDDFDDFQSAATPNINNVIPSSISVAPPPISQSLPATSNLPHNTNTLSADKSNVSSSQDKYAVFRELEDNTEENSGSGNAELGQDLSNIDDSFGDFCSSEPGSITTSTFPPNLSSNTAGSGTSNTTPVSFEVFSTPPEAPESSADCQFEADFGAFNSASDQQSSNYADIHEALKSVEQDQKNQIANSWNDPFGEFEDAGTTTSNGTWPIPKLKVATTADDDEDDFGDFMGPNAGLGECDTLSINQALPVLSEPIGETQSVASLELPGLEMTVGLEASESRGSGSGQSPDLFMQSGVEEQLRGLTLNPPTAELPTIGINPCSNGSSLNTPTTSKSTNTVMESFSGGLMDKYSIIREEAAKNNYDEAHTGSWQRCLEGSVKLLEQGHTILNKLKDTKLKSKVLATSQMQDYLADLQEVWYVCERISKSCQQVTTTIKVDELLSKAKTLWEEILLDSENALSKSEAGEGENQMGENEVCGVCLAGGGTKLEYGGHSYHPPCANLWLNCVDLLLPSLTPVTLL